MDRPRPDDWQGYDAGPWTWAIAGVLFGLTAVLCAWVVVEGYRG